MPGGPGVRWDSHIQVGYTVPPYYDSLLGKLIVHAPTRLEALATMRRALDELVIEGVQTTIPLHRRIFRNPDFIAGRVDTTWVERVLLALEIRTSSRLNRPRRDRNRQSSQRSRMGAGRRAGPISGPDDGAVVRSEASSCGS